VKRIYLILLFGCLLFSVNTSFAQEVYLSISGQNVTVDSGDKKGLYDVWIRPKSQQAIDSPLSVEVYDAGLGGFSDLVYDPSRTATTYALYSAGSLYQFSSAQITKRNVTPDSVDQVVVIDETRFLNRWVTLFSKESAPEEGFILRISTGPGNDVNSFKIRIAGEQSSNWQIVPLDLSYGLAETSFSDRILLKPFFSQLPPQALEILGEEETELFYIDAFGNRAPINRPWTDWKSEIDGIQNEWGIISTGSTQPVNNLVIRGTNSVFPVIFEPQILSTDALPEPEIRISTTLECKVYGLSANYRGFDLDVDNAKWFIEDTTYTGRDLIHSFSGFGSFQYNVVIPVRGRSYPQFLPRSGTVTIDQPPVINLNGAKTTISPAESIVLDASTSYNPGGTQLSYQWYINGEFRSDSPRLNFSSLVSGTYTIQLNVSDQSKNTPCSSSQETIRIVVNTQPYAEISGPRVIASNTPNRFEVINQQDSDGDELAFRWEGTGVVGSADGDAVNISIDEPGMYAIKLNVDDQTGTRNATFATSKTFKVNTAPVAMFSLPTIIAPGQDLELNGSASSDADGDPLTYSWSISDGRNLTGAQNIVSFVEPGDYTIKLSVDDGEGVENSIQSKELTVRVNRAPEPIITAADFVHDSRVPFSALPEGAVENENLTYTWKFSDGTEKSGANVRHIFDKPGTYTATLIIDDNLGLANSVQSITQTIVVNAAPLASFRQASPTVELPKVSEAEVKTRPAVVTLDDVVAPGDVVYLNATSSSDPDGNISKYEWFLNDVKVGDTAIMRFRAPEAGLHNVRLEVRDDSKFDEAIGIKTAILRVNQPPVPRWDLSPKIAEPGVLTTFNAQNSFDSDNTDLQFKWIFEDGVEFSGPLFRRSFDLPGTYSFVLEVDDKEGVANSVQRAEGSIRVNQSPIIVTESVIRSNKREVVFDASNSYDTDSDNLSFVWVLPDGSRRTEPTFTWVAPEAGSHRVSLTIDDGEGLGNSKVSMPIEVNINRPPVAIVDALIEACSGQIIIFSSARSFDPDGDIFTTHWDFGDGNTSRDSNPYHTYTSPGLYEVTLTLDDGFSPEPTVAVIPVRIEGSPQAIINFSEITICANTPLRFDGSESNDPNGPIGAYSWDFGDGKNGLGSGITHLYAEPGNYDVVLTVIGSGTGTCSNISQATARVTVIEGPSVTFTLPSIVSPGESIRLDASESTFDGELKSATWSIYKDDVKIDERNGLRSNYQVGAAGMYRFELKLCSNAAGDCNEATKDGVVIVNAPPQISWNAPDSVAQFAPIMLSAARTSDPDGFIESFEWRWNGDIIGSGISVPLPTDVAGGHTLSLQVRDNSGVANASAVISKKVYINSSPNPNFILPENVFMGETVRLAASELRDADGHVLRNRWLLNGVEIATPVFEAVDAQYAITLEQSDGLGLPNSERSITKSLMVAQPPVVELKLAPNIIQNSIHTTESLGLPEGFVILDGATAIEEWAALKTGVQTIHYGWKPNNTVLKTFIRNVTVFEPLTFESQEIRVEVPWNPANPYVMITAPKVNRAGAVPVILDWKVDGNLAAVGSTAQLLIKEGENRFSITAIDQNIAGSQPITIPVIIIAIP
jgi:PKD repeat protein